MVGVEVSCRGFDVSELFDIGSERPGLDMVGVAIFSCFLTSDLNGAVPAFLYPSGNLLRIRSRRSVALRCDSSSSGSSCIAVHWNPCLTRPLIRLVSSTLVPSSTLSSLFLWLTWFDWGVNVLSWGSTITGLVCNLHGRKLLGIWSVGDRSRLKLWNRLIIGTDTIAIFQVHRASFTEAVGGVVQNLLPLAHAHTF